MGELINLRRVRKSAKRVAKEKAAATNRAVHGTPKQLRKAAKLGKELTDLAVDAHRLDPEK